MASPIKLIFYIYDIQMVLILALLFLGLCIYCNFIWKKRDMFKKSWNFPGPFNFPIIGSGYLFMARPEFIYGRLMKVQEKYPEGFKLWFGNRLIYGLHNPEHIEKILGSPKLVKKEALYKHVADVIGEGLITAPPEKWKNHRKIIMPSFNQKILDSFVEVFAEQSMVLNEVLAENCGKNADIFGILSKCTLDIVCETAMGLQLDIQRKNQVYGHVFDKFMKLTFLKIFQLWNHVDFVWIFLGYDKQIKQHTKILNDLVDVVIKQKMETMEAKSNRKSSMASIEEVPQKRLAFLDCIMENKQFTAVELREEVNIFLLAGSDTTATTLTFLMAVLGMFPDVQQKVLDEVLGILGNDRSPECQDLPHMVYTERVIKETMRLFPAGCFFLRAITQDVKMGDFVVPEGATAFFGSVFIHRNPKYWPDPLKFDPDRFLPEEVAKRHPCTYIPFSYGPRNCIGRLFGLMVMKVIIATVIRKFRVHCECEKIEDIRLKANIVLRFQDDPKISFTPRKQ